MKYKDALHTIDTLKVLEKLKVKFVCQGAYVRFECQCGSQAAAFKLYGDKKNLWYCPDCKKGGNILSYMMAKKGLGYEEAKKAMLNLSPTTKRINTELPLEYDLQYTKDIANLGLSEEFCAIHQIGFPKGRSMLAGCLTFLVKDETGMKVAYYGIRLKNKKHVFHSSFNPELYLYGSDLSLEGLVTVTPDLIECCKMLQDGKPAVCNYGFPYLSWNQISLLNGFEKIDLKIPPDTALTIATQLTTYYRFI